MVGTALLRLPVAHAADADIGWLEALFTATSAVCVTGLIVVNTGRDFSPFGQAIIALLIQMGGLGILTVGVLLAVVTGRRLGFQQRMNLQAQLSALQVGIPRHERLTRELSLLNQYRLQIVDGSLESRDRSQHPQAEIGRDLVVAASPRVKLAGCLADQFQEASLGGGRDILVGGGKGKPS